MRISLINDFYIPHSIGGAESLVSVLAAALIHFGHKVQIITSRIGGMSEREIIEGVEVRRIGKFPNLSRSVRLASGSVYSDVDPIMMEEFKQVLKDFTPDVLHYHNVWLLGPKLLTVEGYRKGVTFHDYWPFCLRRSLMRINNHPCDGPNKFHCRLCQLRSTANLKALDLIHTDMRRNDLVRFLKTCDFFTGPSSFLANVVSKHTNNKVRTINNLYDFDHKTNDPIVGTPPYFLYASRGTRIKGFDLTVKVFSRNDMRYLHLKIASNKILHDRPNIEFMGWQSKESLHRLISGATAVIVPSLWPENSPMIILEALSLGVPVIASRIGGNPELVIHGETGLLFAPGDENSLTEAIKNCAEEPMLHQLTLQQGPSVIKKNFSPAKVIPELEDLYVGR